jgi:hypothetical protein
MNKIKLMLVLTAADQLIDCLNDLSGYPPDTLSKADLIALLEKWRQYKQLLAD